MASGFLDLVELFNYFFVTSSLIFLFKRDFLRAAVFFLIKPFCAALSRAFCAFLYSSVALFASLFVIASSVFFVVLFTVPLIFLLMTVLRVVTRMYFFADSFCGTMLFDYFLLKLFVMVGESEKYFPIVR